ncbi:MAG: DUF5667 domain-containing protein [Chloroflexota bacterium]|nr:DUF5667 domain-containing protein [Chloroflexota bacterium]
MNYEKYEGLTPDMKARFELFEKVPERSQEATFEGRALFLEQARALRMEKSPDSPVSVALPLRLKGWINNFQERFHNPIVLRKERFSMLATLTTLLVTLGILFGGAGATVYAAQDSLPNEVLYELKVISEDLRLNLTRDPDEQLNLALEYTNERMQEMASLWNDGEPIPPQTATRYQEQLSYALQLAAQFDDADMIQAAQQIRSTLEQQERVMTKLTTNAPDMVDPVMNQIRELIRERIRMVDLGLEEPLTLRQQLQQHMRDQQDDPEFPPAGNEAPGVGPETGPGPMDAPRNESPGMGPKDTPDDEQKQYGAPENSSTPQKDEGCPDPDADSGSGEPQSPAKPPTKDGGNSGDCNGEKTGKP